MGSASDPGARLPAIFAVGSRACGSPLWRVESGHVGIGRAAWCPDRAASVGDGQATLEDFEQALGRLRNVARPGWVAFGGHEDAFVPGVDPARRDEVVVMVRRLLGLGVGVAMTTRGALPEASALVALARMFPGRLSVRVGVFSLEAEVAARWEPGLPGVAKRLALARELGDAGADVEVELGPIVPFVNDDARGLKEMMRTIARHGVGRVAVRWIEDASGLAEQVAAEVSRSASRLLEGWLHQPGSNHGAGQARGLAAPVRRARLQTITEAARAFGREIATCACQEGGHAGACPSAPRAAADRAQLELFGGTGS